MIDKNMNKKMSRKIRIRSVVVDMSKRQIRGIDTHEEIMDKRIKIGDRKD